MVETVTPRASARASARVTPSATRSSSRSRRSAPLTPPPAVSRTGGTRRGGGQVGGLAQRLDHAALVGLAGAGDVEGGAVVDAGADHRQAHGDVDACLEAEHLDRAVPLVVVHRHDEVEVPTAGAEEHGVGGERSEYVDALAARLLQSRGDLLLLLAAAEEAVLPGVRVDAADRDAGVLDAGLDQGVVAAAHG